MKISELERLKDELIEDRGALLAATYLLQTTSHVRAAQLIQDWVEMREAARDESLTMKAYRDGEEAHLEMRGGLDRDCGLGE